MRKIVVGIDEVGRGSLAGPVVAAAVCILEPSKVRNRGSFDSKTLTPKTREELCQILTHHPLIAWGVGRVSEKVIDKINILQATRLAMKKALQSLLRKLKSRNKKPDLVVLDGKMSIVTKLPQISIVKADAKIFPCMIASIIAKVTRDRLMMHYHEKYPRYGFNRHKGYGTPYHLKALRRYGPCSIHRLSFAPCKQM